MRHIVGPMNQMLTFGIDQDFIPPDPIVVKFTDTHEQLISLHTFAGAVETLKIRPR